LSQTCASSLAEEAGSRRRPPGDGARGAWAAEVA